MRSNTEKMAQPNRAIERGALAQVSVAAERKDQLGFTLVELITVMVIVGILAVAVLPRFFTVSDFEDRGSADQVKSMLRFAQKTAIAQHRIVSVAISTAANADEVNQGCTTSLSSGNLICKVKTQIAAPKTVWFDALGRPVVDAGGVAVAAQDSILVGTTTILIEAQTGYVY